MPPLEAHIGRLRHLTNDKIAKDLLRDIHKSSAPQTRETSKIFSSHIAQALNFHSESKNAISSIRPVLQYYAYLNLSVAAILAYRPNNYNQYRRHGVEDKTYSLTKLELSSNVLTIKRGAVPLFHSIISDTSLYNKKFRLGQLAAGFQMCSHELKSSFGKTPQIYYVNDDVINVNNKWFSVYKFFEYLDGARKKVPQKRIETAMPMLETDYTCNSNTETHLEYTSKVGWKTQEQANEVHRNNGIKFINFGGHQIRTDLGGISSSLYTWHGVSRIQLLPTLTSTLLLSFSLASIVRYRPMLLDASMNSPILLIIDTFVSEADSIFMSSLCNLLYREEVAIGSVNYI